MRKITALTTAGLLAGALALPVLAQEPPDAAAQPTMPMAGGGMPMMYGGQGMPMMGGMPGGYGPGMMGGMPGGYGPGMMAPPVEGSPETIPEEGAADDPYAGMAVPPCYRGPGAGAMGPRGHCPMGGPGYRQGPMGGMHHPMMMGGNRPMMRQHMATMEQRLANIEALLRELVELQKAK